jgi:hypothetical protein
MQRTVASDEVEIAGSRDKLQVVLQEPAKVIARLKKLSGK